MAAPRRTSSASPYEASIGFARALRIGDRVLLSGTAPVWPDGHVDPDPAAQARRCFDIAAQALEELGSGLDRVIRTRMYLVDKDDGPSVGAVHAELFSDNPPVATMVVVAGLLDDRWRVEVELEATAEILG